MKCVRTDSAALVAATTSPSFLGAPHSASFVASAVIFFLPFLGTGIGLSMFTRPSRRRNC